MVNSYWISAHSTTDAKNMLNPIRLKDGQYVIYSSTCGSRAYVSLNKSQYIFDLLMNRSKRESLYSGLQSPGGMLGGRSELVGMNYQIAGPGDVIPDQVLAFSTSSVNEKWFKGVKNLNYQNFDNQFKKSYFNGGLNSQSVNRYFSRDFENPHFRKLRSFEPLSSGRPGIFFVDVCRSSLGKPNIHIIRNTQGEPVQLRTGNGRVIQLRVSKKIANGEGYSVNTGLPQNLGGHTKNNLRLAATFGSVKYGFKPRRAVGGPMNVNNNEVTSQPRNEPLNWNRIKQYKITPNLYRRMSKEMQKWSDRNIRNYFTQGYLGKKKWDGLYYYLRNSRTEANRKFKNRVNRIFS